MRLVETADVIVENMRAAVKHRLKVAYDDVRAVNPRIVYGSISGFGQDGPDSERLEENDPARAPYQTTRAHLHGMLVALTG